MQTLHEHKEAAKSVAQQDALLRQIDATDRAIDSLVYDLYALTQEEIALVESEGL